MQRSILNELISWKNNPEHLPLLLRGARQVGKTYIVQQLAQNYFEHFVNINFELDPDFIICFQTLKPTEIIKQISLKQNTPIIPGQTLLFLDEIQICPNAIMALRYFKEQIPNLHIIGAGSLLEFALSAEEFRMPVGRVQYLYMYPLSFNEFLLAQEKTSLLSHIQQADLQNPPSETAHKELLKLLREYFILGGMPAVIDSYIKYGDLNTCQNLQSALLATYRNDFGKYAKRTQHKYLTAIFSKAANLIGKHVKYSHIDPNTPSRDLKPALNLLQKAGLIYKINASSCSGLPLNELINEKIFKLIFIDIGLVNRTGKINLSALLNEDLVLVNQGTLTEQFVGQELLMLQNSYEEAELCFWARNDKYGQAEVDYVINLDNSIVPIEVKSGKTGTLRSLKYFLLKQDQAAAFKNKPNKSIGVRISQHPLNLYDNILSLPLYMVSELPRIFNLCK